MQYTVIGMSGLVSLMSNGDMEIGWLRRGFSRGKSLCGGKENIISCRETQGKRTILWKRSD